MNRPKEQNGDALLQARVRDALRRAQNGGKPQFVGFLDEREAAVAAKLAEREEGSAKTLLFGGYEGAERVVLGAFPPGLQEEEAQFPIRSVTASYKKEYSLSHRDFLGTLMSLGIERETVGDILPGEGRCVFFVRSEVAAHVLSSLEKVGGVGVSVTLGMQGPPPSAKRFAEIAGTIASARLDCVLSALTGASRADSAARVSQGLVSVNHAVCQSAAKGIAAGDVVTIKGQGKFVVDEIGPPTRKNRFRLLARKYL